LDLEFRISKGKNISLPIVDLQSSQVKAAEALHQAFHTVGFAYVLNHDVDYDIISRLMTTSREFFAQNLGEKNKISMAQSGLSWRGYFPPGGELTQNRPDLKEGLYFGAEHPMDHPGVINRWPMHGKNQWPEGSLEKPMRELVLSYLAELTNLGHRLMELVAFGLGLDRGYFLSRFTTDPTLLFRIFHYPKDPKAGQWGVAEHTDMGFLTILMQDDNGGLELKDRTGKWLSAQPKKGTFVINIGDMLEYWTRGIYRATPHRVKNLSGDQRLAMPFFFDPAWHSPLTPIEGSLLRPTDLAGVKPKIKERWDGLDLLKLSQEMTYGEYVWSKVKTVFPALAHDKKDNHDLQKKS
jgi:isopenicillin N synthase-like dioxygenase